MAFPNKGDRVTQPNYGPGTVLEIDTYHTVIDFDSHGTRRFATNRVVLAPTKEPKPPSAAKPSRAKSAKKVAAAAAAAAK